MDLVVPAQPRSGLPIVAGPGGAPFAPAAAARSTALTLIRLHDYLSPVEPECQCRIDGLCIKPGLCGQLRRGCGLEALHNPPDGGDAHEAVEVLARLIELKNPVEVLADGTENRQIGSA